MIAQALYTALASDVTLTGLLATYEAAPAIFTTDPAPADAVLPYIVAASIPVDMAFDTKTTLGRTIWRDIRIYAEALGSVVLIDQIAERVRALLHRQTLTVAGYDWVLSDCAGPISADVDLVYGRIITVKITLDKL